MHHVAEGIQADELDILSSMRCDQMTQTGSFYQLKPELSRDVPLISTPLDSFHATVSTLAPDIVIEVCRGLQLDELSPVDSLFEFASTLPPSKYVALLRLLAPMDLSPVPHTVPSVDDPSFVSRFSLDFRYSSRDFTTSTVFGPLFLGSSIVDERYIVAVPQMDGRDRVVLQCVARQGDFFPLSLTVRIGGHMVVGPGVTNAKLLDVSALVQTSEIEVGIESQHESQWFCLVMRVVRKLKFSEILQQILAKRIRYPLPESIVCPFSGKIMEIPAKSLKCRHLDCFDLSDVLKRTRIGHEIVCPICQQQIQLREIIVNWEMMRMLIAQRIDATIEAMRAAGIELNNREAADPRKKPKFVDVATQRPFETFASTDIGVMTFPDMFSSDT